MISNLVPPQLASLPPTKITVYKIIVQENQLNIKGVYKSRQESQNYQCRKSFINIKEISKQEKTIVPALATLQVCWEDQMKFQR